MAIVPLTNQAQLSDPLLMGQQMTDAFASLAHPINSQQRARFVLRSRSRLAAVQELFIDGLLNFRFKGLSDSTFMLRGQVVYNSSVPADSCAFDCVIAARVNNNVMTIVGAPVITKFGASAATLQLTVNTPPGTMSFNATGVVGNINANWCGAFDISEITDFLG